MVEWTEEERVLIREVFRKLKYEDVGPKSLCRYVGKELARRLAAEALSVHIHMLYCALLFSLRNTIFLKCA